MRPLTIDFLPKASMEAIPQRELFHRGVKLLIIGSLAWDYADTVRKIAAQMRLRQTKPLCRAFDALRLDYDRLTAADLDAEHLRRMEELSLLFEDICGRHFSRLCQGVRTEMGRSGPVEPSSAALVTAVQMAMTVLDAMAAYAEECDAFARSHYPGMPHSLLHDHYRRLAVILPQFAGDLYEKDSPARKTASGILLDEIKRIDIDDD